MQRREILGLVGAGVLAGCLSDDSDEGDAAVDETVDDTATYNLDVESGNIISINIENDSGLFVAVSLADPSDSEVLAETVEDTAELEHEAAASGAHNLIIEPDDEATVTVSIG